MYTTHGPASVISADFDGDGCLDIAVFDPSKSRVIVWIGDGRGGFGTPVDVQAPFWDRIEPGQPETLTARETETAILIALGYTDREIGTILGIGRRTAETHAANVLAKLNLKSRRELLRRGVGPAALASAKAMRLQDSP